MGVNTFETLLCLSFLTSHAIWRKEQEITAWKTQKFSLFLFFISEISSFFVCELKLIEMYVSLWTAQTNFKCKNPSNTLGLLRTRIRNSPVSRVAERSAGSLFPSLPPTLPLSLSGPWLRSSLRASTSGLLQPGTKPHAAAVVPQCKRRHGQEWSASLFLSLSLCWDIHLQWTNLRRIEPFPAIMTH